MPVLSILFLLFFSGATPLILILHANRHLGLPDRWFCVGSTALLAGVWRVSFVQIIENCVVFPWFNNSFQIKLLLFSEFSIVPSFAVFSLRSCLSFLSLFAVVYF